MRRLPILKLYSFPATSVLFFSTSILLLTITTQYLLSYISEVLPLLNLVLSSNLNCYADENTSLSPSNSPNSLLNIYKLKKVEVVPYGVTTSYNPAKTSPFTRTSFKMETPLEEYIEYNIRRDFTLAELIHEATRIVTPNNVVNTLHTFLDENHFRADAEYWEGSCQRWGGWHGSDRAVNLACTPEGFVCGNLHLDSVDIAEYLTAVYPHSSEAWYGTRTEKFSAENEEVNTLLTKILDNIGYTSFSPIEADKAFMKYIGDQKKRLVTDVDPTYQVWNQPSYSWERVAVQEISSPFPMLNIINKSGSSGVISSKDHIPNSMFYKGLTPEAQDMIQQVDAINEFMANLYIKMVLHQGYSSSDSITSNGITSINNIIPEDIRNEASAAIQVILANSNYQIGNSINNLIYERNRLWREAEQSGIQLKKNIEAIKVHGRLGAIFERSYRNGQLNTQRLNYTFYILKDKKTNQMYSKWEGARADTNYPDFVWVPKCNDDECLANAKKFREAFDSMPRSDKEEAAYPLAVANLYQLLENCISVKTAKTIIPEFVQLINKIDTSFYNLSSAEQDSFKELYKQIVETSKINLKALNDLMNRQDSVIGLAVETKYGMNAPNQIVFLEYDPISGSCIGNYEGQVKYYPREKCVSPINPTASSSPTFSVYSTSSVSISNASNSSSSSSTNSSSTSPSSSSSSPRFSFSSFFQ